MRDTTATVVHSPGTVKFSSLKWVVNTAYASSSRSILHTQGEEEACQPLLGALQTSETFCVIAVQEMIRRALYSP